MDTPASPASGDASAPAPPPTPAAHVRTPQDPTLNFPPVQNGVDYLRSVVDHLDAETGGKPRDLKYAVLHLQAAVEVLLKARLHREHWSLVFKDPGSATTAKRDNFSFISCGTDHAVTRLRNIAGITITKKEADALDALTKDRNALQHYGLNHSLAAVESRAAEVLDFLVRFLDDQLLPALTNMEHYAIAVDVVEVRRGLNNIHAYVAERMNRLRTNELQGKESSTLEHCPNCNQGALIVAPGEGHCHFCGTTWDASALALGYQVFVPPEAHECPSCFAQTFSTWVTFLDGDRGFCFTCGKRYAPDSLRHCAACGGLWPMEDNRGGPDQIICGFCERRIRMEEEAL